MVCSRWSKLQHGAFEEDVLCSDTPECGERFDQFIATNDNAHCLSSPAGCIKAILITLRIDKRASGILARLSGNLHFRSTT